MMKGRESTNTILYSSVAEPAVAVAAETKTVKKSQGKKSVKKSQGKRKQQKKKTTNKKYGKKKQQPRVSVKNTRKNVLKSKGKSQSSTNTFKPIKDLK